MGKIIGIGLGIILFLIVVGSCFGGGSGERCVDRVFYEGNWICIPANDWMQPVVCDGTLA
jgi:hypothetical protein